MSEKLLVTQALDERDLLVKKINDKIAKAQFLACKQNNEENVISLGITPEEFGEKVKSAYQQITDLIERFNKIDAAIVASNAGVKIETSYGTFTVAGAISLRNRLRGNSAYGDSADFEGCLMSRMMNERDNAVRAIDMKNKQVNGSAESMRLAILGKDSKMKDDKPLEVVDAYVRENTVSMVDPICIQEKIDSIKEKRETLIRELDTQIKVSNATTYIEI